MTYLHICKYANEENKNVSIASVVYYGVTYRTFKPKFEKKNIFIFQEMGFSDPKIKKLLKFFSYVSGNINF